MQSAGVVGVIVEGCSAQAATPNPPRLRLTAAANADRCVPKHRRAIAVALTEPAAIPAHIRMIGRTYTCSLQFYELFDLGRDTGFGKLAARPH